MEKNREYELKIEGYTAEGAGVARLEGMVVFVPGAARGDLCRVRIVKVLKTHAFGKLMDVLGKVVHYILELISKKRVLAKIA